MNSITNESFIATFVKGFGKEIEIGKRLAAAGWKYDHSDAGKSHDIVVTPPNSTSILVEVKNEDNFAGRYENIIVEYYQSENKKPSGILSSKALIWIHTLKDMVVIYQRIPMIDWLDEMDSVFPLFLIGKADNNNWGRKVPIPSLILARAAWNEYLKLHDLPRSRVWGWTKETSQRFLDAEKKPAPQWTDDELAMFAKRYHVRQHPGLEIE
jgi:hypothetical protein